MAAVAGATPSSGTSSGCMDAWKGVFSKCHACSEALYEHCMKLVAQQKYRGRPIDPKP